MPNPLRNLPAVNAVLNHPEVRPLLEDEELSRVQLVACVRQALSDVRERWREDASSYSEPAADAVVSGTLQAVQRLLLRRARPVINATGIILHTNLGRAPLPESSIERLVQAARATNVELDLTSGQRARRGRRAEELLRELTGAPAALIVNNCAAATMLALQGTAAGREVIISRGQLVEIGGGFRLPEVFEAAGVVLKEVGTSNRTRVEDYSRAITQDTAAILRVHRSNFRVSGFVAEPSTAELVTLAKQHDLPVIDDLGSGCLTSLAAAGLQEPDVATSLRFAADLILFSGDKLLGGPQAGVLIGDPDWIERLRQHPLARALRVCKLTLAALEATLECHLAGQAFDTVPVLTMLGTPAEDIRSRCEALVEALSETDPDLSVVPTESEVGGGSLADQKIASFAVQICGQHADLLLQTLRTGKPSVLGRIEGGAVLLDLRSVRPHDDPMIEAGLRSLAGQSWGLSR